MWESVETIVQYGMGPAIAAGALLWQQSRTDKRDQHRSDNDYRDRREARAAEMSRAAEERKAALYERWRDERLNAHSELLHLLSQAINRAGRNIFAFNFNSPERTDDPAMWNDEGGPIDRALARVQLIASSKAAQAAGEAQGAWLSLSASVLLLVGTRDAPPGEEEMREAWNELNATKTLLETYRSAARQDLEVD